MAKIIGIGVVTIVISLLLKETKPEFSLIASVTGGMIITLMILEPAKEVINSYLNIENINVANSVLMPVIKVIGLGYLTEFGATLAEDCGVKYLASKIYFAGKISILAVCLPLAVNALNLVLGLI